VVDCGARWRFGGGGSGVLTLSAHRSVGVGSLAALVNLATMADGRYNDIEVLHAKEDSKTANSRRSLFAPALQGFRVLGVVRIGLQFFELLQQPVTGRRIAPFQVFCGRGRD
jgi:hypothetical protein